MPQKQSQALPALVSFFLPGIGQLIQGRGQAAIGFLLAWFLCLMLFVILIGFLLLPCLHVYAAYEAAVWEEK